MAGRIAGYLTTALTWLAAAYDTERIVLAGGVSEAGDTFLEAIREQVRRRGVDPISRPGGSAPSKSAR